ncbi:MAG TPA: A/G-specific adenine glycosylase [Bryobacterales bacterium]|nr:A/G-specific adenine glycosylase [Bryobacterales bacterium]
MPVQAQQPATVSRDKQLVAALLRWYRRHRRDLPWRKTSDPYAIWVSEIMLQQTRVTAALPYYERFLNVFPDVCSLARAPEARLLEVWSGLGYYRRARQMQQAARVIVEEHGGAFPDTFEALLALPGVGPYTAAAIASIAFGRPHAVLDGNVIRVMSRLVDEDGDVARSEVKEALRAKAQSLGDTGAPRRFGEFNQAVMELGATLCVPRNPRCLVCPLAGGCVAYKRGMQESRPVKPLKGRTLELEMVVAVVRRGLKFLMRQRPADAAVMPGFWELPERAAETLAENCLQDLGIQLVEELGRFRHAITFRSYRGRVYRAKLGGLPPPGYRWIAAGRLDEIPLTTVTRKALKAKPQAEG